MQERSAERTIRQAGLVPFEEHRMPPAAARLRVLITSSVLALLLSRAADAATPVPLRDEYDAEGWLSAIIDLHLDALGTAASASPAHSSASDHGAMLARRPGGAAKSQRLAEEGDRATFGQPYVAGLPRTEPVGPPPAPPPQDDQI